MDSCSRNNLQLTLSPSSQPTIAEDLSSSVPITQTTHDDEQNHGAGLHSSNTTTVTNLSTQCSVEYSTADFYFDVPVNSNEFVKCYQHAGPPKNIFPFSCQSFTDLRPEACKFRDRGCLLKSWNLASKKVQDKFINSATKKQPDPTVFPVPTSKQKNNGLFLADTKLITCSNPACIKIDEDGNEIPTVFHYCCYVNMKAINDFQELEYNAELDKLGSAQNEIVQKLLRSYDNERIILPVCRKACFNKIMKNRQLVEKAQMSTSSSQKSNRKGRKKRNSSSGSIAGNLRWDSDSKNGSRTSEEILVHWLTDEENAEKYFGGSHGSNNQVNGTRKDAYHSIISHLILQENGHYRSKDVVKAKIDHLVSSYKMAHEKVMSTGEGLDTHQEFAKFMTFIHERHCKWYTELDTVLASRHNVWPAYTNEDDINESSQDSNEIAVPGDTATYLDDDDNSKVTNGSNQSNGSSSSTSTNLSDNLLLDNNESVINESTNLSQSSGALDISDLTNDNENECAKSSSETTSTHCRSQGGGSDIGTSRSSTTNTTLKSKRMRTTKRVISNRNKNDSSSASKMTVIDAAKARKEKRKTIVNSKSSTENKMKLPPFLTKAESHFDDIFNAHNEKLKAQADFHAENMLIQNNRLNLERERLNEEKKLSMLQQEKLKGEILRDVTEHNFEMMKKRKETMEMFPNMTKTELDSLFPFRTAPNTN